MELGVQTKTGSGSEHSNIPDPIKPSRFIFDIFVVVEVNENANFVYNIIYS